MYAFVISELCNYVMSSPLFSQSSYQSQSLLTACFGCSSHFLTWHKFVAEYQLNIIILFNRLVDLVEKVQLRQVFLA